jgi:putative endonuclease
MLRLSRGYSRRDASLRWHDGWSQCSLMPGGYVYIMSNKPFGVLYTGVSADIAARVWQHKNGSGSKFCKRYNCDKLVFAEPHAHIEEAIAREKAIKARPRLWKLELISAANPNWEDLYERINR